MSGVHRYAKMGAFWGMILLIALVTSPAVTNAQIQNNPPEPSDCPTIDLELQWHEYVTRNINWTDAEGDPLVDVTVDVGDVVITGMTTSWSYFPNWNEVGSHVVTLCATDDQHTCPTGNECVFTVSVLNTPPAISNCISETTMVGALNSEYVQLGYTDLNTGDVIAWSIDSIVPTPVEATATISDNGNVSFTGSPADTGTTFSVYVKANDLAGDSDECTLMFEVVSEIPYEIVISVAEDVFQGYNHQVDIIKQAGSNDMYGFNLVIAYDASALMFCNAIPGVLFDTPGDYEWEYFTYRFGPDGNCGSACPSGMVTITALADYENGAIHPLNYSVPDGTVLFSLNFLVSNDRVYECQFIPIKFFWMDCNDNTIAYHSSVAEDPLEILLAVSRDVFFYVSTGVYLDVTDLNYMYGFPTYYGIQEGEGCLDGEPGKPAPRQFIDFYGGGIDIKCADEIDNRGDVNLNGIAYEIADLIVFIDFLLNGYIAFTINEEDQYLSTDVYVDATYATINDLVYMIAVLLGDVMPYEKSPANSKGANTISWTTTDTSLICTGNFTDSLGGMYLKFYAPDLTDTADYEIVTMLETDDIVVVNSIHDDSLFVLAYRTLDPPEPPSSGLPVGNYDLLEIVYSGRPPLLTHASAAGRNGEYIDFGVDQTPYLTPQLAAYPDPLYNDNDGGFYWDFDIDDPNGYPELMTFTLVSGPGELDAETGVWEYYPYCAEIGDSYTLELCAGYPLFPCELGDPATVQLNVNEAASHIGDADGSGEINLADIWYLINYLYLGGPNPQPAPEVMDADQDGLVNINDVLYIIYYLYLFGPEPICP